MAIVRVEPFPGRGPEKQAELAKAITRVFEPPFGLMERRRRERRNLDIAHALETMAGKEFPSDMRREFPECGSDQPRSIGSRGRHAGCLRADGADIV